MNIRYKLLSRTVRTWEALQPVARVSGSRVGLQADNVCLLNWRADWKTEVIGRALSTRPGLFIDVGANVGQTLLDYLACPGRQGYVGFEPNSKCVELVMDVARGAEEDDIAVVPIGLSEAGGLFTLFLNEADPIDAGATIVADLRPGAATRSLFVPTYRFDDIASEVVGDRPISLIKIDVEGGELGVLAGMTDTVRRQQPLIICEVLTRYYAGSAEAHGRHCRDLMALIKSWQYSVLRIEKEAHERALSGYSPVDAFPEEIHTHENKHLCDYIFVPPGVTWPPQTDHSRQAR